MKSQNYGAAALLIAALTLGGCTGLQQFPEVSKDYVGDLNKLDPDYGRALAAINAPGVKTNEKKRIRNEEIDRRLAVIDANFKKFEIALAKESVQVDFLVAVVKVGVGGAGALVAETASQILSAASAGLVGVQEAYGKAALSAFLVPERDRVGYGRQGTCCHFRDWGLWGRTGERTGAASSA